MLKVWKRK